ncbi:hypothetical protein L915_13948 [Phytophthora nicotianae]|uniref:Tc1-like transposase DDE domain-containing protein n=1 Tax=Phytophthora nicotianae TaxID=4792 RepID=W2GBG3_PHYNI|nr:hypothetical protein L915_13948 [Phytophthora nicotianae]
MQAKRKEYGLSFNHTELKAVLWAQLKPYVQQNVKPVVVAMAEKEKPAVLFTPPHHSNLQPIETVWAAVKGEVGRQYTAETTFQQVRDRLVTSFRSL